MRRLFLALLSGAAAFAQSDVEAGLLLLGELGCHNCHMAKPDLESRVGPVLTGAGAVYREDHVPSFASMQGGTLTAIRRLLASSPFEAKGDLPAGSAERGARLFGQAGCAACHEASFRARDYAPGRLAAFLLDPLAVRPSGRMPRVPLTPREAADLALHLQPAAAAAAPSASRGGAALFASAGCANCHQLLAILPKLKVPSMVASARGCLAERPPAHVPDFRLSAVQRESLRVAIAAHVTPEQALRLRLAARSCLRCHTRDAKGGPAASRTDAFTVLSETDLGDEGRLPPPLTAIGYKLTPEALRAALRGETRVHPQMATRMPDYGAAAAADLARRFTALDMPPDFKATERTGRNAFGRQLAGIAGLGCINCHNLRGRKSLGIGASDLALTPKRLRVEWFRDFLMEPSRFHPATRMPSFWPNGKAVAKNVLRGDAARQIDSLWVYLLEIDQTRLPEGMEEKAAYELKPEGSPIVLRAFLKDAGTHAVAVGFPEGVHAAFDSNQIRWALAWRGRFLDAEGVWEDRFNPPLSPLGTDVIRFGEGRVFDGAETYRFRGYRLDARGVPAFLYDYGDAKVEDRLAPKGKGFERTLQVTGHSKPLWFRAAAGRSIVREGDVWVVDGKLRIRVSGEAVLRGGELLVNIDPGVTRLREEIEW